MIARKNNGQKFYMFASELVSKYFKHSVGRSAAALAYYLIFSFFPLLIFISVLVGYADLKPVIAASDFAHIVPEDIMLIVNKYIEQVTVERSSKMVLVGGFFTFYFPMRAVNSLMDSINTAYGVHKPRTFFKRYIVVILFTVAFIAAIIVCLFVMIMGRELLTFVSKILNVSNPYINIWNILRFFILALTMILLLYLLYYITPNKKLPWCFVLPGTLAALTAWLIASIAFSFYVENLANYSVVYGSIGAVIVLIVWLYLTATVLILGAEVNHALMVVYEFTSAVGNRDRHKNGS